MGPSKCFRGDSDELTECCAQHVSFLSKKNSAIKRTFLYDLLL